ncbi:hypothetical protein AQUSIP_23470 [Aquicella siphonis]|uniref:Uncharacterized protein n=1 Tax=Aquicella siphonis TaxID=254247 RepID=A0A5E4PJ30_9COXI|nr:YeiH family protein [Aquicella siphonis]VVC77020.1 hypothetical protein AQUSIP_23470 [Aquicella siphonis]
MISHTQSLHSQKISGLVCVSVLAWLSYMVTSLPVMAETGISSLVIAIVLGILFGNTLPYPASWTAGIQFAAKRLLRIAIILYGFRVSFQQIASVGVQALAVDILIVSLTLTAGYYIGRKVLRLDRDMSLLISAGSAICGAAAVLAVEDVLKSEPYKAAVAIGTVVLFGTASMFLYPLIQHAGLFGFNDTQFGVFAGASVHEVAQALVAGANVSPEAGKIAVIVKMMRVLLLVPVLIILSFISNQSSVSTLGSNKLFKVTIPWFALGFVAMIGLNSTRIVPSSWVDIINQTDIILLTMAMGAIGIETKLSKMKNVGLQPLYLAVMLFVWLLFSAFLMIRFF